MARYVVVHEPGGRRTRVRRIEETRPGQGLGAADLRPMPLERKTKLALAIAWFAGTRGEMVAWVDRWHLRGIVIFFLLVYVLPLSVLIVRECVRDQNLVGTDGAGLLGLGVLLLGGSIGLLIYRVVRPSRR